MRLSFVALPLALLSCTPPPPVAKEAERPASPQKLLEKLDVVVGAGAEAKQGSAVSVHYVGTLTDGTKFDSSRDRGQPFTFIIGQGKVIRGWEQGVVGMRVGGTRKLVIPPHLGYGEAGQPPTIPGQATLHFEIELLHVVE
jgi:FKBP-type peptidyl-prolyl cis-trans isomerase FkpA